MSKSDNHLPLRECIALRAQHRAGHASTAVKQAAKMPPHTLRPFCATLVGQSSEAMSVCLPAQNVPAAHETSNVLALRHRTALPHLFLEANAI